MNKNCASKLSIDSTTHQQVDSPCTSGSTEKLPKQFVSAMRTLFDILDDEATGLVRLSDIEHRWQDDGAKGIPHGVMDSLRKVTPPNGLLSFDRFCAGLKICLLQNESELKEKRLSIDTENNLIDNIPSSRTSASLLDYNPTIPHFQQWNNNNTAAVRPNNAIPVKRTLSLPKLSSENNIVQLPEILVIPSSCAPPKPPRTAMTLNNVKTTNNNMDKAEIRNALQNWQMGVIMNEMDVKDKNHMTHINRGTADGSNDSLQLNRLQKKTNPREREPRRHTLQNGIDYNTLKKLKYLEQEKELLLQGLLAVEKAQEWYYKQISFVQDKIKYLAHMKSYVEQLSETHRERLGLQRARVMEINRHLSVLTESWERPIHMNLAVRYPNQTQSYKNDITRLKQQNQQLTEEVNQKNERVTMLEQERQSLIRELLRNRMSKGNLSDTDRLII